MSYDAVLVHGFGGPEAPDEVMPFLERVTAGRGVPRARLEQVAEHYHALGGRSPINDHGRALARALEAALEAAGLARPVRYAARFAAPYLPEVARALVDGGATRLLAVTTSAFSGHSSCRAYVDGERAVDFVPIDKVRQYWNHPGVVDAWIDRLRDALASLPAERRASARVIATAHSIPLAMAATSSYQTELAELARLVGEGCGRDALPLVFQSRSGPPSVPWLEPDVLDALRRVAGEGVRDVVIVPLGFTSDHVEVIWDLDHEAKSVAESLGLGFVRAATLGTHPRFVDALVDLVRERVEGRVERPVRGRLPAAPDVCAATCCPAGRPPR